MGCDAILLIILTATTGTVHRLIHWRSGIMYCSMELEMRSHRSQLIDH